MRKMLKTKSEKAGGISLSLILFWGVAAMACTLASCSVVSLM
jgi:hypothetical protein